MWPSKNKEYELLPAHHPPGASKHTRVDKKLGRPADHAQRTTQCAQEVSARERARMGHYRQMEQNSRYASRARLLAEPQTHRREWSQDRVYRQIALLLARRVEL